MIHTRSEKYIFAIILVLTISGCSKNFDLHPQDTISDVTYWKSATDYIYAANNLYLSLPGFSFEDTESDIAFNVANEVSNGTLLPPEVDSDWNTPYAYIRRCNNIIEKSDTSPIKNEILRYVAEAKFFRAFNYWKLYRLYGGVPLITSVLNVNSEELYYPREERQTIIDFILNDLTECVADLPENDELKSNEIGRITKGAANALKARIALYEGTWRKYHGESDGANYLNLALEASEEVINSAKYSLFTGKGEESYRYFFTEPGDDSPECILDRRYESEVTSSKNIFPQLIQREGYLPTKKLADMYLCSDGLPINKSDKFEGYKTKVSEFKNRDPRMTMTMMVPGTVYFQPLFSDPMENWPFYPQRVPNTGYIMFKYMSDDAKAIMYTEGQTRWYSYDHHIIRYAEVLLIYAEALYEINGTISDEELDRSINLIRHRAGMPHLNNAFVATNGLEMKEELRRERTIELAMEGFRYDDLRRWKTAETELPKAIRGINIVHSDWTDPIIIGGSDKNPYAQDFWQNSTDEDGFIICEPEINRTFDPNKHYLRPIPTKEIRINQNLIQNSNW